MGRVARRGCVGWTLLVEPGMSRYRRPDRHFNDCLQALAQKPRHKLEPGVLYAMFEIEANSQCILNAKGKCPLLVFTNQLCDAINEYMFGED